MDRELVDTFEIKFKFAFRNLKSAILLGALLFALCASPQAQQLKKRPAIGILGAGSAKNNDRTEAFFHGMRELGYGGGEKHSF